MSDTESVVFLSESDDEDEDVKEIPKDDDYEYGVEEEGKIFATDAVLPDKRGEVFLRKESFLESKVCQEECEPEKQDMTTQTDDLPKNESESSDTQSTIRVRSSDKSKDASTGSNKEVPSVNDRVEDAESKRTVETSRSRSSSITSRCNNGKHQSNSKANTRKWSHYSRMHGNCRLQPYNKSSQCEQQNSRPQNHPRPRFAYNYNHFGVPSPSYHNFARQLHTVRERYIEQFKEYLCSSFSHFLNNSLPFTFPLGYNDNNPRSNTNIFSQGNNNFPQGINHFALGNNVPQEMNNFSQGNNLPLGINNFPQDINTFPQSNNNYPRGINTFPQGNPFHRNN